MQLKFIAATWKLPLDVAAIVCIPQYAHRHDENMFRSGDLRELLYMIQMKIAEYAILHNILFCAPGTLNIYDVIIDFFIL